MISRKTSAGLIAASALALMAASLFFPNIPQPQSYHRFADARTEFGLANALNVLSNIPFILIGLWGLFLLFDKDKISFYKNRERWFWVAVSLGLILTAVGSYYYHLAPDNDRLVLDRLPITIVFMSFISALIFDRICSFLGWTLWPFLIGVGLLTVLYWHSTEEAGNGDLRFYLVVQGFTFLSTMILLATPSHYTRGRDPLIIIAFYALAVLFEAFDTRVFHLTEGVVSGHTLKHLAAALASFWMIWMIRERKITPIA